ncbi:MAG TPA: dehydrogenase, partial [Streptomyces sp.]
MPVLTRLIPSPVVVDINGGALADLAGLLADQRISTSGKLAVAVS